MAEASQINSNVGISYAFPSDKIRGELYSKHDDFIVQELFDRRTIRMQKYKFKPIKKSTKSSYLHTILVKRGISTFEACKIFADKNKLNYFNDISACGLKDTFGLTAQKICVANHKQIQHAQFDNFYFTAFKPSNKKLEIGSHTGNHFLITVRNTTCKNETVKKIIKKAQRGVPNFYHYQRFGIRQNNHSLGKMLIQKRYRDFLRHFFTDTYNEDKKTAKVRRLLASHFGEWGAYKRILKNTNLNDEKELAALLCKHKNENILNAIKKMKLSRFFTHSYVSYLFNMALSDYIKKHGMKQGAIMKLGSNTTAKEITNYTNILKSEGIELEDITSCPFVDPGHSRNALFTPKNFKVWATPKLNNDIILSFDLGKGEYASLVLDYIIQTDKIKWC